MSSNSVCNHTRDWQIGFSPRARPILLITRTITDRIGLRSVLLHYLLPNDRLYILCQFKITYAPTFLTKNIGIFLKSYGYLFLINQIKAFLRGLIYQRIKETLLDQSRLITLGWGVEGSYIGRLHYFQGKRRGELVVANSVCKGGDHWRNVSVYIGLCKHGNHFTFLL